MLVPLDGEGPLYRQIYRVLRGEILARRLRPGDRLPSTRWLSADLGVSRNVALLAYEQLLAEGYAESRVGSGTIVAPTLPDEFAARLTEPEWLRAFARTVRPLIDGLHATVDEVGGVAEYVAGLHRLIEETVNLYPEFLLGVRS